MLAARVMCGLCCNSLIRRLVDLFKSSPSRLTDSLQHWGYQTGYLPVDRGSSSCLINSLSLSHFCSWPKGRWQYFTTNPIVWQNPYKPVIFCIYIRRWCGHISLSGTRLCSAEGQMLPTQRQLFSASLRFLPWTYVGCQGLWLSQAVALLGASWCEWMGVDVIGW